MTEVEEWQLRKENVELKKQLLQLQFNLITKEEQELGPNPAPPPPKPELKVAGEAS